MATYKIGVVGAGGVGSALGGVLAKKYPVKYGSRDPASSKIAEVLKAQPGTAADTIEKTVDWADVVLLATPGITDFSKYKALATSLGPGIKGKVLLDATNPMSPPPQLDITPVWSGSSGGELLAAELPETAVFKAFNTIGVEMMSHPDGSQITGEQLTMLFAGPLESKDVAEAVVVAAGWKPVYVGPIRYSRNLEAIAELWTHLSYGPLGFTPESWGGNFHFQVIKKP